MLRMRLTRVGSKKRPAYRVVVADSRAPRDGRHVDIVGHYNPMTKPSTVNIDTERAVKWLQNGAQPSDRVRVLLRHSGVLKAHEEARLAAKKERKGQPSTREAGAEGVRGGRAARKAAAGTADAARNTFRVIVRRAAGAVSDAAERVGDAADTAARRTRPRAGAATKGTKTAAKKTGTAKSATKPAAKKTSAAKSAEKTAARKGATKAAKS